MYPCDCLSAYAYCAASSLCKRARCFSFSCGCSWAAMTVLARFTAASCSSDCDSNGTDCERLRCWNCGSFVLLWLLRGCAVVTCLCVSRGVLVARGSSVCLLLPSPSLTFCCCCPASGLVVTFRCEFGIRLLYWPITSESVRYAELPRTSLRRLRDLGGLSGLSEVASER
ncbi:hypothetical protein BC835DRAFT_385734 [Cytidiella melzeri]|nr:hypothetical protein BC835DRAFT_385734 [Cytidiella melzeri]